jgi:guanidinoacetate N-methyltransferase
MTRRIRRTEHFELTLVITAPEFIRPPRDSQRNWLLNRAVKEFAEDLSELDALAGRFAEGVSQANDHVDRTQAVLGDREIMEDWQIPLMSRMADIVAESGGDILEVGFGRGVSASMIQQAGVSSHTIVECNDSVVERFEVWRDGHPGADIRLITGRWEESADRFAEYDGIFFHTYPLNADEYIEYVNNSVTFAESFFETAAAVLRDGGVFTYLTNEIDSMSRSHQRLLFDHFSEFTLSRQKLEIPQDVQDMWWADSMVVVKATK